MISFVVPLYNKELFVGDTILSILHSAKKLDIEILVVNDCSTDNSLIHVMQIQDKRIKVINLDKNSGPAFARNEGIKSARYEYIFFLDSDDLIHEDLIPILFKMITKSTNFICVGITFDKSLMKAELSKIDAVSLDKFSYHKSLLKNDFIFTASSVCINKNVLSKIGFFDTSSNFTEDSEFWARLSFEYDGIYIENSLAYYRIVNNSLSSQFFNKIESIPILLKTLELQYNIIPNNKILKDSFIYMLTKYIIITKSNNLLVYKELLLIYKNYKHGISANYKLCINLFSFVPHYILNFLLKIKRFVKYKKNQR